VERNPRIVDTLKGKVVDYMNRAEELKTLLAQQQSSYRLLLHVNDAPALELRGLPVQRG
jgi:hypothetical protein